MLRYTSQVSIYVSKTKVFNKSMNFKFKMLYTSKLQVNMLKEKLSILIVKNI